MNIADLFTVVIQPEHSKQVLCEFQRKYNITTNEFIAFFNEGISIPNMPQEDINEWVFQYKIFLAAEGNIEELIEGYSNNGLSHNCSDNFPLFDDPCL